MHYIALNETCIHLAYKYHCVKIFIFGRFDLFHLGVSGVGPFPNICYVGFNDKYAWASKWPLLTPLRIPSPKGEIGGRAHQLRKEYRAGSLNNFAAELAALRDIQR